MAFTSVKSNPIYKKTELILKNLLGQTESHLEPECCSCPVEGIGYFGLIDVAFEVHREIQFIVHYIAHGWSELVVDVTISYSTYVIDFSLDCLGIAYRESYPELYVIV